MTYGPNTRRQDIDLIQTLVIRRHALLKDSPPPAAPATKKPVPAAWLPTEADKKLLQSYLCGTTDGLKSGPYDLGTSGPDGDGVDGIVGPKTMAAVRDFQRNHGGLVADGVYGPKTKAVFDAELNGA